MDFSSALLPLPHSARPAREVCAENPSPVILMPCPHLLNQGPGDCLDIIIIIIFKGTWAPLSRQMTSMACASFSELWLSTLTASDRVAESRDKGLCMSVLLPAHPCPPPAGRTPTRAGFICVGTAPRPASSPSWLSSIQQPALEHCWSQHTAHSPSCTHTHTTHAYARTHVHTHTIYTHMCAQHIHTHAYTLHNTQMHTLTYTLMNTPHAHKRVCAHTHTHTIYTLVHAHTHGHAHRSGLHGDSGFQAWPFWLRVFCPGRLLPHSQQESGLPGVRPCGSQAAGSNSPAHPVSLLHRF